MFWGGSYCCCYYQIIMIIKMIIIITITMPFSSVVNMEQKHKIMQLFRCLNVHIEAFLYVYCRQPHRKTQLVCWTCFYPTVSAVFMCGGEIND